VEVDEFINTWIYEGLKYFGVKFWIKDDELHFKYPEIISGNTKDLFKFIKDHEQGIMRAMQQ
jgi:hypothetical protein